MDTERQLLGFLPIRSLAARGADADTAGPAGARRRPAVLVAAFAALSATGICAEQPLSPWDATLQTLQLARVHLQASSLSEAWSQASGEFLIRSVLCVTDTSPGTRPFTFHTDACTAGELFKAFTATYPEFTWTRDSRTGIMWLHPQSLPYADILSSEFTVSEDQLGVPAFEGVVPRLTQLPGLHLRLRILGITFRNTFNYPVDVARGTYSGRGLLNTCCTADPTKAFYVYYDTRRAFFAVDFTYLADKDRRLSPRPGALRFWEVEIGPAGGPAPTEAQIKAKLADPSPRVRWAARNYVGATVWATPFDKWAADTPDPEQAIWVCIGMTSVLVKAQSQGATHLASIARMKREATSEFLTTGNPGLAVLTAMELCRLTKDARHLDVVSRRAFKKGELSGIVSDAFRIARLSEDVRNALRARGIDWLQAGDERLAALGDPSFAPALRFTPETPASGPTLGTAQVPGPLTRPATRKAVRIELPTTSRAASRPGGDAGMSR